MNTVTALFVFASFAQAGLVRMPPLEMRHSLDNSTTDASDSHGATLLNPGPTRNYDTTAWRVYIAVLVLSIMVAVLALPVVFSPDLMQWYRSMRGRRAAEQRKVDIDLATATMHEMTQPENVYLRPERVH